MMMAFHDHFDLSINTYLVMSKINSIPQSNYLAAEIAHLENDMEFYKHLPVVKGCDGLY